jgi:hypothetical protein
MYTAAAAYSTPSAAAAILRAQTPEPPGAAYAAYVADTSNTADAAPTLYNNSSSFPGTQYEPADKGNTPHVPWHSTQQAQHEEQHQAAALCEAAVVFQQLAELQLLHTKLSNCLLCLQEPRSAVLLPCKHLAVCNACCKQLTAGAAAGQAAAACPLCGAEVLDSIEGVMLPM